MKILATIAACMAMALPAAASAKAMSLAVFGDDPASSRGMPERFGFAERLQESLSEKGYDVTVRDFADSGETTKDALRRLRTSPDEQFDAVILAFGAADLAEGYSPAEAIANLQEILQEVRRRNPDAPVLVAGTNARDSEMASAYGEEFGAMFERFAERFDISYYPDFMKGVAYKKRYLSNDGTRPNAEGYIEIVDRLLPVTEELLTGPQTASSR